MTADRSSPERGPPPGPRFRIACRNREIPVVFYGDLAGPASDSPFGHRAWHPNPATLAAMPRRSVTDQRARTDVAKVLEGLGHPVSAWAPLDMADEHLETNCLGDGRHLHREHPA